MSSKNELVSSRIAELKEGGAELGKMKIRSDLDVRVDLCKTLKNRRSSSTVTDSVKWQTIKSFMALVPLLIRVPIPCRACEGGGV